jgi:hypothetical protein
LHLIDWSHGSRRKRALICQHSISHSDWTYPCILIVRCDELCFGTVAPHCQCREVWVGGLQEVCSALDNVLDGCSRGDKAELQDHGQENKHVCMTCYKSVTATPCSMSPFGEVQSIPHPAISAPLILGSKRTLASTCFLSTPEYAVVCVRTAHAGGMHSVRHPASRQLSSLEPSRFDHVTGTKVHKRHKGWQKVWELYCTPL